MGTKENEIKKRKKREMTSCYITLFGVDNFHICYCVSVSLAVLGGLSSEDRAVDSNSSRKRPLLQITDRNKKAPNGGQSNA